MNKTDLLVIPGVGKNTKEDLINLGYNCVEDLNGQNPEDMYERFNKMIGYKEDRCQLYVFRCAVYYASNEVHDEHLLKWWNWKDGENL
jgi:Pathogenicity locus.